MMFFLNIWWIVPILLLGLNLLLLLNLWTKKELDCFLKNVQDMLQNASSLPKNEFADLMKELTKIMSKLALNNGVLYNTELDNLVSTFVKVGDLYPPQNSKMVTVDLVKRMDFLENFYLRATFVAGVVTTLAGIAWYWPSVINKLELSDQILLTQNATFDTKLGSLGSKADLLGIKADQLDKKVDLLKEKSAILSYICGGVVGFAMGSIIFSIWMYK